MTDRTRKSVLGAPIDRVDGRLKVTGGARFVAELPVANPATAVVVTSTVARARILSMDTAAALRVKGVLAVLTPFNAPRVDVPLPARDATSVAASAGTSTGAGGPARRGGSMRIPTVLQSTDVHYNGQPIGVVVAETFEAAMEAARLVTARYATERPALDMERTEGIPAAEVKPMRGMERMTRRGDVDAGLRDAAVRVEHEYRTPLENHNPMEVHQTVAAWEGNRLTLHDSTQGIFAVRNTVAQAFGLKPEDVRVVAYFTGGGFGSKGGAWSHQILAAMAAREVKRPVKLALTRRQMFGPVGGRAITIQHITLGATRDGALTAIRHTSTSNTSALEDWIEPALSATRMLYACPNVETQYDLKRLNIGSPTFMRAPGESTGTFAFESALDELAYELKMDPVQIRLKNHADRDPVSGKPWSSKSLRECYALGAERFGWSRRTATPRSMRDGRWLVGWGMASATYPANRQAAGATARMSADGTVVVRAGTQEIGCGTYTAMSQIAADVLSIPVERVRFELGATDMPENPSSVGSWTASSTGGAVHDASVALKAKLDAMVQGGESHADAIRRAGSQPVEVTVTSRAGASAQQFSSHTFGAVFTEVRVDPELGLVRVPRVVTAHGVGKILNEKMAKSQIIGGVVWGIGMALHEETHIDPRSGRYVNAELAEYLVPVNADVGTIEPHFVDEDDRHVSPMGAKGVGEIGITGVAASIANAVFHATGKRIRELPLRVDRVMA
ncbi:MAG: xanthine dehydrogenase family protein molybdopterin-binding subunit [Gemmatimonadaceae bacterium]